MQNRLKLNLIMLMPFITLILACGGPTPGHNGQNRDGGYDPLLDTSIPAPTNLTTDADVTYDMSDPNDLNARVVLKWQNNATNQDGIVIEIKDSKYNPDRWVKLLNRLSWNPTQTEEAINVDTATGYTHTASFRIRAAMRKYPDGGGLDAGENPINEIKAYSLPSTEFTVTIPKP